MWCWNVSTNINLDFVFLLFVLLYSQMSQPTLVNILMSKCILDRIKYTNLIMINVNIAVGLNLNTNFDWFIIMENFAD